MYFCKNEENGFACCKLFTYYFEYFNYYVDILMIPRQICKKNTEVFLGYLDFIEISVTKLFPAPHYCSFPSLLDGDISSFGIRPKDSSWEKHHIVTHYFLSLC